MSLFSGIFVLHADADGLSITDEFRPWEMHTPTMFRCRIVVAHSGRIYKEFLCNGLQLYVFTKNALALGVSFWQTKGHVGDAFDVCMCCYTVLKIGFSVITTFKSPKQNQGE